MNAPHFPLEKEIVEIKNVQFYCCISGISHPIGMGRSVEPAMTPRFLHPVMDASLRDAGAGEDTICYRAIIPMGLIFAGIGFYRKEKNNYLYKFID